VFKPVDRKIDIVSWDFFDGSPSVSGPYLEYGSITHTFQDPGEYQVACLAVDDGVFQDFRAYETVLITVTNPETSGFNVTITGSPLNGCPDTGTLDVSFTSTVTGGTPPYTYSWDFGDGSGGSTEANPSHSYEGGTNLVQLTVIDDQENEATSNTLTVAFCQ
jgi:PKD repeat protein